jgi:uncharacterized protein DUF6328
MTQPQSERLPLSKAAEFLLDECRMVLPGIQALFGFQLIAVFSPGFDGKLDEAGREIHLVAIGLVAIAVALVMAPAAYNRHKGLHHVTETFLRVSNRLLLFSMPTLALAICLDFYLIAGVIVARGAGTLATGLFVLFAILWLALPRTRSLQRALGGIE